MLVKYHCLHKNLVFTGPSDNYKLKTEAGKVCLEINVNLNHHFKFTKHFFKVFLYQQKTIALS